jgi:hypothetical protein
MARPMVSPRAMMLSVARKSVVEKMQMAMLAMLRATLIADEQLSPGNSAPIGSVVSPQGHHRFGEMIRHIKSPTKIVVFCYESRLAVT